LDHEPQALTCPGTSAAVASFQKLLKAITHNLPFVTTYNEFLLVHSQSHADHL
jgi:hypothetical protein